MNPWIKCKDKLPKDNEAYLCALYMNDMGNIARWQQVLYFYEKKKIWCENSPLSCALDQIKSITNWWQVTHYQKLPELPE